MGRKWGRMTRPPLNGNMSKDPSGMSEGAGRADTAELLLCVFIATAAPLFLSETAWVSLSSGQLGWAELEEINLTGDHRTLMPMLVVLRIHILAVSSDSLVEMSPGDRTLITWSRHLQTSYQGADLGWCINPARLRAADIGSAPGARLLGNCAACYETMLEETGMAALVHDGWSLIYFHCKRFWRQGYPINNV